MKTLIVSSDRTDSHGGACNLGDALLTDALASAFSRAGHESQVYDFGFERTTADGDRLRGGRVTDLARAIRRSDRIVIGGGTLLQDDQPHRLLAGLPRLCATVATIARAYRRPVAFYGVGCDTVDRPSSRALLRIATSGSPVWLRDEGSRTRFEKMCHRPGLLGADAALLARPELRGHQVSSPTRPMTLALNRSEATTLSAETVRHVLTRTERATFLSMEQQTVGSDVSALRDDVSPMFDHHAPVLSWRDAADIVAESRVVLASRMHALYLALMMDVPAVAVGDREKVISFAKEFSIPHVTKVGDYKDGDEAVADPAAVDVACARAERAFKTMLDR